VSSITPFFIFLQPKQVEDLASAVLISHEHKKVSQRTRFYGGLLADLKAIILSSKSSGLRIILYLRLPGSLVTRMVRGHDADLVTAYSSDPTLRLCTVFTFYHVLLKNTTPGRVFFLLLSFKQSGRKYMDLPVIIYYSNDEESDAGFG
jgi:hypothetical protein